MPRRKVFFALLASTLTTFVARSAGGQTVPPPPPMRIRLVGVYDARSGAPIEGAEVTDVSTHGTATTPKSGVVGLALTDTNGTFVSVKKIGYSPELVLVGTGLRDTVPLTVVLRSADVLPAVVTKSRASSRGAADTVRALEMNGFYNRRQFSGAPSSAFLTSEKIEKLSLVSDAAALSGRQICSTNLYLDGVRVVDLAGTTTGMNGKRINLPRTYRSKPIDQLVNPSEVMAIEFYHTGDAPVEYNATRPDGAAECGVTLVWTK
jgi:hypothetical protein